MKVEINIDELTSLKNEIAELKSYNKKLEQRLHQSSSLKLEEKALRLAEICTDKYINEIFKQLGFSNTESDYCIRSSSFRNFLYQDYTDIKDIKVSIGVNRSNEMFKAFLEIGIDCNKINNRTINMPGEMLNNIKLEDNATKE